jgi:hypothetical protein
LLSLTTEPTVDRSRTSERMRWIMLRQSEAKVVFVKPLSLAIIEACLMAIASALLFSREWRRAHRCKGRFIYIKKLNKRR